MKSLAVSVNNYTSSLERIKILWRRRSCLDIYVKDTVR